MEAGLICISTDCISGPRELIQNKENGYLFGVGDVEELASILKSCLSGQRIILGKKAKNSVKRLSLPLIFEKWVNLIEQVRNS